MKKTRNFYGDKTALLTQIELVYQNGTRQVITSNQSWKASTGPILFSDIYDGELYDARLEKENWSVCPSGSSAAGTIMAVSTAGGT